MPPRIPTASAAKLLCNCSGSRLIRGKTSATAAVPISLNAVAAGHIAVHRRHVAEQTAVGTVLQQMASHFNAVAWLYVFAFDADLLESCESRRLHGPDCWLTLIILHLDIEPGMRNKVMHFGSCAFHSRPLRKVVVAVGVMPIHRQ